MIDRFTKKRIRKNREFFNINPEEALNIFRDVQPFIEGSEIELGPACAKDGKAKCHKAEVSEPKLGRLYCRYRGADAKGVLSGSGIKVLKGSKCGPVRYSAAELKHPGFVRMREALEKEGVIVDGIFVKDHTFDSPSAASAVCEGRPSSNGQVDWKDKDGKRLKEWL